jgi:hypothetical protein
MSCDQGPLYCAHHHEPPAGPALLQARLPLRRWVLKSGGVARRPFTCKLVVDSQRTSAEVMIDGVSIARC